jgi:hypothetical protein
VLVPIDAGAQIAAVLDGDPVASMAAGVAPELAICVRLQKAA